MNPQVIKELFENEVFKSALKNYIIENLSIETEDGMYSDGVQYRDLIVKFANEKIFHDAVYLEA